MRVSRDQAEKNRGEVIAVASRLFRERGYDGVGLAELMKAAGLTHGAFYGQFGAKAELEALASERALGEGLAKLAQIATTASQGGMEAVANYYLSEAHRDAMAGGCALAALAPDAAREDEGVRAKFTDGITAHLDLLASLLTHPTQDQRADRAAAILSMMVGALALARATQDAVLSRQILAAAMKGILSAAQAQ